MHNMVLSMTTWSKHSLFWNYRSQKNNSDVDSKAVKLRFCQPDGGQEPLNDNSWTQKTPFIKDNGLRGETRGLLQQKHGRWAEILSPRWVYVINRFKAARPFWHLLNPAHQHLLFSAALWSSLTRCPPPSPIRKGHPLGWPEGRQLLSSIYRGSSPGSGFLSTDLSFKGDRQDTSGVSKSPGWKWRSRESVW